MARQLDRNSTVSIVILIVLILNLCRWQILIKYLILIMVLIASHKQSGNHRVHETVIPEATILLSNLFVP